MRFWRTRWLNKFLALTLAGLWVLISTQPGLAHATLTRSTPAESAVLATTPPEIQLWFSEEIVTRFSAVRLLDGNGQPVANVQIAADPAEPNLLVATVPELSPGVYSALWRVLSQADGHFSQGMLVFGVGVETDLGAVVVAAPAFSPPWPEVILRWVHLMLLLSIVGAIVVGQLVLVPLQKQWAGGNGRAAWREALHRVLQSSYWCAGFAIITGIGLLGWQVATTQEAVAPEASLPDVGWLVLNQTRWGTLWLIRQTILLLLGWVVFWQARTKPEYLREATILLCIVLLAVQALTGHAASETYNLWLTIVVATLHLLAASVWMGGLLALTIGLLPLLRQGGTTCMTLARTGLRAFSLYAGLSLGLLIATGLYNVSQQVASADALITTLYGQALLSKMGLVLIASLFGLLNWLLLHPDLAPPWLQGRILWQKWMLQAPGKRCVPILAELCIGGAILLATSWITATPPPRGLEYTVDPEGVPAMLSQTVDDLVVTLEVKPNRPGQNVFSVRSASARRPPPAEIKGVLLRFTQPGQDSERVAAQAQAIEPGRYWLIGDYLKLAGDWQIEVVTQRNGLADSVAHFTWVVAPPGAMRSVVLSKQPWQTPLTLAAAGLLLVLAVLTIGGRWRTVLTQLEVTP